MPVNRCIRVLLSGLLLVGAVGSAGAVKAQTSVPVVACVNPASGTAKFHLSPQACQPGWIPISLTTGGGAGTPSQPRIVDANDIEAGIYTSPGSVLRKIGSIWVHISFVRDGFAQSGITRHYTSIDCSGTPLVEATPGEPLVAPSYGHGATAYYPTAPPQAGTIYSYQWNNFGGSQSPCFVEPEGFAAFFAPLGTFTLGELGLTAPFRLAIPE